MPHPDPVPPAPTARSADWEAFYRDYRKPGYVPGFEITSKLGGGMFGLVFRARRMSIGKDYAIKFLQVDDSEVRRAVLAELEQVKYFAQIDHPNLVSIEDRGEVDGIPYLVMQFAGTSTLKDQIPADGNPPPPDRREELLRWYLQACRGTAALHERSLVHFDIKPANVFLKGPVARIGDYGLSKLITHSRGSLSMGRGTPYYMAPEMLQRRGDHRSDVYSLGVVLYEILCGSVPFRGDSEWEVLRKHESEAPALPPHLSPTERAVLQRCLQKDPAARFQSVHDLIGALGAPASSAAAAVREAGLGSTKSSAEQSSTAGPAPGPAPADDPYKGFQRASREALGHAQKIAREALGSAREVAQKAAKEAEGLVREHVRRAREGGSPSWFARFRARPKAPPPPPAPPRRRSGKFAFVLVAALFVVFVVSLFRSVDVSRRGGSIATTVSIDPPLLHAIAVPGPYRSLVTVGEPDWVATAERDLAAAQRQLARHLQRLRELAPVAPAARAKSPTLPSFAAVGGADGVELLQVQSDVTALAEALGDQRQQTQRLQEHERLALLAVAERLSRLEIRSEAQLAEARRLHEFLVETTGCCDIPFVDDRRLGLTGIAAQNRGLGTLWLWYVHEVANTERAWNAYRNVRPH